MSSDLRRGAGNVDAILILAFLVFVTFVTAGGNGPGEERRGLSSGPTVTGSGAASSERIFSRRGSYESGRRISISSGNAAYSYQPYEEYITVENRGDAPVDITGWQLRNGKDKRVYDIGGSLQRFSADVAVIPQAARLLSPSGESVMQNVVLSKGERAVITTGSVGPRSPYRIVSFKENACTGYLERLPDYAFKPPLQSSCPRPANEPGLEALDTDCRMFVESLSSCETPEFDAKDRDGEPCDTCLDGKRLSSSCAAFIRNHFGYAGCVAYHAGDPDFFSRRTWRVFLGRSWEMWARNYESIELFDLFGNLMASQNY